MSFKKHLLCISLVSFLSFYNFVFSEIVKEPYKNNVSVSVSSFSIDKDYYSLKEKIVGEFVLVNMKDKPISNIKYSISLKGGFNDQMGYFEKTYDVLSYSNISIDSFGEKKILLEYNIPDIPIEEDCAIEVRIFNNTGLPLSTYTKNIKIEGDEKLFSIVDSYIEVDSEKFFLQAGPSIRENREGVIKLEISNVKEDINVFPKVRVFDRSVTGKFLKEESVGEISLKSDIINNIKINFTDIIKTAGVYEAELILLDQNDRQLSEKILFRYIVYGDIVAIHNLDSDNKIFNKGDSVKINLYYTGSPYDIVTGETPKQSIKKTDIVLRNYFGSVVSKITDDIDYTGEGKLVIPMILNNSSKFISAEVKIYDQYNQILVDYKTDLVDKNIFNIYRNVFMIVVLILLSILSIFFILKKKRNFIFIIILLSFVFSYKNVFALNPFDFIHFSNATTPTLQDLNFYYVGGSPITNFGTYTENGITLNTLKVSPGANFIGTMYAILDGCSNARMAEVNFDNVGGTNTYKYIYRNDPSSDGTRWPKGNGSGYMVLGDDNQIGTTMDYFTAPMVAGIYKIPLVVNTWEYTGSAGFITSGPGYMYIQVYKDGECGDANGRVYESGDIGYSPYKQCLFGTPSNNIFPNLGATSTWICRGSNGGTDSGLCSAARKSGPEIKFFNVSSPITTGSFVSFSWDSINTVNCDIYGNTSNLLKSGVGVSTTTYTRLNNFSAGIYSYTLRCYDESSYVTKTTNYQVVDVLPPPTLTLTGDSSVLSGASPTLSWSATNVKTCTKSAGWNGDISIIDNLTSGTEEQDPIYTNTTYDISCVGLDNSSIHRSLTVEVINCSETKECEGWSECIDSSQSRICNVSYTPFGCSTDYEETETRSCGGVEIRPLTINCQAYQNFGSGYREASTGTIYVNRDMEWRLFINDPNTGNTSYYIDSPQGELQDGGSYYYLSKLYQNSGLKIFNAKVTGSQVGGEGVCATSVNAVVGGQIIIEE